MISIRTLLWGVMQLGNRPCVESIDMAELCPLHKNAVPIT